MNFNYRAIVRITGLLLLVIGLAMIPALIVAAIYNELPSIISFAAAIMLSLVLGLALLAVAKSASRILRMRDGFLIVSLAWFIAALIGSLPFIFSGSIPNFIDAFFEMCSGFSTTGCSILSDVEALPKSMLFWRSFTHWMGGMGIIIFAIALLPSLGLSGQTIARAEIPGPTLDKVTAKMSDTAKTLYLIYGSFTLAEVILLCLGNMSLYDSLIQTFGTVGTGGFSNYQSSIAEFNSPYINTVITVFMLISGTSFNLYYATLRGGLKTLIKDSEYRFYLIIFVSAAVLITLNLYTSGIYDSMGETIDKASFQTASILTTTGFATANYDLWPTFSKMLLFLLMFIGGCSGSTGGGIKVVRILVVLKYIRRGIALRLHPKAVVDVKLNDRHVRSDTVSAIVTHVFLFAIAAVVGTILISVDNFDMITNLSAVVSCIGNVGPGFSLVGPAMDYSIFSGFSKMILSVLMIAGRLELVTLFVMLTPRFWNPNH